MKRTKEIKFELTAENVNKSFAELMDDMLQKQILEIEARYIVKFKEIEDQKNKEIEKLKANFSIPYIMIPDNTVSRPKSEKSAKAVTGKRGRPKKDAPEIQS